MRIPRLIITAGEPAGIGPDIITQIAQHAWIPELIVVGDPTLLKNRAQQLQLPLTLTPIDFTQAATSNAVGTLKILPVALNDTCVAGKLNVRNAPYVLHCLELATTACLEKQADALITAPVHKGILNDANIAFTGHTEFLAQRCDVTQAIMLFVIDDLKIALATTHIPLAEVPKAITAKKLITLLRLLNQELKSKFHIARPKILVCGLNPHAGENGHLGREEIDVIIPALQQLRAEHVDIIGPLPADTIFTKKNLASADAILALYHDQALPVVKYMGFERAVNVTLGLPIIRTSVDHGTALDLAGSGQTDPSSLISALNLAAHLVS